MYTNKDLDLAVAEGIFSDTAINKFRSLRLLSDSAPVPTEAKPTQVADARANDIFVVMGCMLLVFGSLWTLKTITDAEGVSVLIVFISAMFGFGLAKVFSLKRQFAIPAIALLLACVSGVLTLCIVALL
ncbi:MAG: hypothetical protein QGG88_02140 [Gammaproteobacteria bacterium]|jgi:hypothetical protein|nr:hypothetical protein [Gammaproteobacteria bacterium]